MLYLRINDISNFIYLLYPGLLYGTPQSEMVSSSKLAQVSTCAKDMNMDLLVLK